jgi:hypothetical protein
MPASERVFCHLVDHHHGFSAQTIVLVENLPCSNAMPMTERSSGVTEEASAKGAW